MGHKATGPGDRIAGPPMQNMKQRVLIVLLLLSFCAPVALAKQTTPLEKNNSKSDQKMPASVAHEMKGYEETKKALDEESKQPSLKEKASKIVDAVKTTVVAVLEKAKQSSQRGDPKTDYSQSENRQHSSKAHEAKKHPRKLDLSTPAVSHFFVSETTVQANYSYDPADPYEMVIVIYDAVTKRPLSATGYIPTMLDTLPDLSSMTLVSSAVRSDGTLASQRYQTFPDATGAYTQVSLTYDETGALTSIVQTFVQPLNLKKVKLPELV